MRIAIFTDTFYPRQVNGVAKAAYTHAQALEALGHTVRVWSPESVLSVPFWGYPGERFVLPLGTAYRQAKAWAPDVIHTHTPFTLGWEAALLARSLKVPLVGTHHTFFDHYLKHVHLDSTSARTGAARYLMAHYGRYDLVLSPSRALLEDLRASGLTRRAEVFPNGIDVNSFIPANPAERARLEAKHGIMGPCVIYMGRLSYEKSIDQVIDAFAIVQKALPESMFLLVGDGPERVKLMEQVEELGLSRNVVCTGMLHGTELLERLQLADVFVTASKSENMPLSILEAMAAGLPVVGVDALGVPEIVRDGSDGYIVPPDDREAMAEKIRVILSDQAMQSRFASAARSHAEDFGQEKRAEALIKLYENLCA